MHLLNTEDNDTQFRLLQMTRKAYSDGNERIRTTTPPIITAGMKLARRFKTREHLDDNWSSQSSALYKFLHSSLSTLYTRVNGAGAAELCPPPVLRLRTDGGSDGLRGGGVRVLRTGLHGVRGGGIRLQGAVPGCLCDCQRPASDAQLRQARTMIP